MGRVVTASLVVGGFSVSALAADETKPAAELPEPAPEFLDGQTIRKPDGMLVHYYRVDSVDPQLVQAELKEWLDPKKGEAAAAMGPSFRAGVAKNSVIIRNTLRITVHENNWPVIKKILAMVDQPQPAVYVEAKIVELTYDDQLRVGIDASNIRTDAPVGDLFFKRFDASYPNRLASDASSALTLGSANKFVKFDYVLQLGASGARAEVLSSPGIIASQGEPAKIEVGDREPIVTQNVNGSNVTATTKFEPVGLLLNVTPLMIGRTMVRASIQPEVSRVSEFRTTSTSTDRDVINPVISTRKADTVVEIPSGETVVISGLTQTTEFHERSGIPLLKDIPVVGYGFGATTKRKQKIELVVFVTLTIMKPGETRVIVPPAEIERTAE